MRNSKRNSLYYSNRKLFGFKALFYVEVGGRGCGKTFSTQNYALRRFFKYGEKFVWLRLTENSVENLLKNNASDLIDSMLIEKWKITEITTKGNTVYFNGREACRVYALSTFFNQKGVALNKKGVSKVVNKKFSEVKTEDTIKKSIKKFKTIILDEMNREKNERKTFDIAYSFVNQLENICRFDTDRRIILLGNTLDEASDILASCFNFIPHTFGIHKLHNKRCVIDYIPDSDAYKKARSNSIAGILAPKESTFTNAIQSDLELVTSKKPGKPTQVIRFNLNSYFTVCGNIVTQMKVPKTSKLPVIAMKPYLAGYPFYNDLAKQVINFAQQRMYKFDSTITLKLFYREIKSL